MDILKKILAPISKFVLEIFAVVAFIIHTQIYYGKDYMKTKIIGAIFIIAFIAITAFEIYFKITEQKKSD